MALDHIERLRLEELYDVYDLVEALGLSAVDIIDAFADQIEDDNDILRRIGSID